MAEKATHMTLTQRLAKLGPVNQSRIEKVVEWLEEAERIDRNYGSLIYQLNQLRKQTEKAPGNEDK